MYTVVKIGITESQLQSLLDGHKIFVEKSQFNGDVAIPMTKKQATTFASASRGVNLKLSGPQIKALKSGEGFLGDVAKAALPIARKGINWGLDKLQSKIPTGKAGILAPIADVAVKYGRKGVDWGVDKLQDRIKKMFGGDVGIAAIDAKYGKGWFKDYLLPGLETAAKIALPVLRGKGAADYHHAIDEKMGEGWFKDYLLPGIESAAKIAVPILRGRGLKPPPVDGEGLFSSLLGGISSLFGGGWEPMTQKKLKGQGLVL